MSVSGTTAIEILTVVGQVAEVVAAFDVKLLDEVAVKVVFVEL